MNRWLAQLDAADVALEDFFALAEHRRRPFLRDWPAIERALRQESPPDACLDEIIARLGREKIHFVAINDPRYPARLLRGLGLSAPTFLYYRGRLNLLRAPTVAMVGTRKPSPEGIESARAYAAALAGRGIRVVSGHARGIDLAAHQAALEAGGATVAVLPHGILSYRPAPLLEPLISPDNTLVLSQFAPDAQIDRHLPVQRNPTIAALGDGLIVVETGFVGGSSYAFREARRMRKPIWTVVYREPVPGSAAGNRSLLSAGALPLEPGIDGAERCATDLARLIREEHRRPVPQVRWPPSEAPGQNGLF